MLCSLHPMATRAAVQVLSLDCICGPDGGFLATAPPTLRSLNIEGLPDFKARGLLSQTCYLSLELAVLWVLCLLVPRWCTCSSGSVCVKLNNLVLQSGVCFLLQRVYCTTFTCNPCDPLRVSALWRLLQNRCHLLWPRQSISPTNRMIDAHN
jgi:hypothetical protein